MRIHGKRRLRKYRLKRETELGRIRRVFFVTAVGENALKECLNALISSKRITDSLVDYYNTVFSFEG